MEQIIEDILIICGGGGEFYGFKKSIDILKSTYSYNIYKHIKTSGRKSKKKKKIIIYHKEVSWGTPPKKKKKSKNLFSFYL